MIISDVDAICCQCEGFDGDLGCSIDGSIELYLFDFRLELMDQLRMLSFHSPRSFHFVPYNLILRFVSPKEIFLLNKSNK